MEDSRHRDNGEEMVRTDFFMMMIIHHHQTFFVCFFDQSPSGLGFLVFFLSPKPKKTNPLRISLPPVFFDIDNYCHDDRRRRRTTATAKVNTGWWVSRRQKKRSNLLPVQTDHHCGRDAGRRHAWNLFFSPSLSMMPTEGHAWIHENSARSGSMLVLLFFFRWNQKKNKTMCLVLAIHAGRKLGMVVVYVLVWFLWFAWITESLEDGIRRR